MVRRARCGRIHALVELKPRILAPRHKFASNRRDFQAVAEPIQEANQADDPPDAAQGAACRDAKDARRGSRCERVVCRHRRRLTSDEARARRCGRRRAPDAGRGEPTPDEASNATADFLERVALPTSRRRRSRRPAKPGRDAASGDSTVPPPPERRAATPARGSKDRVAANAPASAPKDPGDRRSRRSRRASPRQMSRSTRMRCNMA